MSVLTAGPSGVVDLAGRLSSDLEAGRSARQSYGTRDAAFAWASGLPMIVARVVSSAVVDGLSFNAVRVSPSGTPAGRVAAGATKPNAVTLTSDTVPLSKYAGLATIQTEQAITTEALVSALAQTITSSCLLAYDDDCVAEIDGNAGHTGSGAAWADAILDGIGLVVGAGGSPGILLISAADYAAAVGSPGVGYAMNPTDGVTSLFGLSVIVSGNVTAGTAYVLDPAACLAVENSVSPLAVVDPYSGLATNDVRIAVEAFLGFVVIAPGSVAKITGPAPVGTGGNGGTHVQSDYALGA